MTNSSATTRTKPKAPLTRRRAPAPRAGEQLEMRAVVEAPVKRSWGGKREGAGRKPIYPKGKGRVAHRVRARHHDRQPAHVTVRALAGIPSFRAEIVERIFKAVLRAQRTRKYRNDFQVVHFSIQTNHLHLIVEANGDHLRSGVSGLVIAFAKRLNNTLGRTGRVWGDRYHTRDLGSPIEVRNVLKYVLMNYKKHGYVTYGDGAIDPRSSAVAFDGWATRVASFETEPWPILQPRTWLLGTGWRTRGLLHPREQPA